MEETEEWEITCDPETFARVRKEEKFPYIVTLARAVNALNFIHTSMLSRPKAETPENVRNLVNSYLFASALLYEALNLVRKMNRTFADDNDFQTGLRMLLKSPIAQKIEQDHLNAARNHAVFHFLPDEFKTAIDKAKVDWNVFVTAMGKKNRSVHYAYSDVVAAEILVGMPSSEDAFWPAFTTVSEEISNLVLQFAKDAENLIGNYLKAWGFKRSNRLNALSFR